MNRIVVTPPAATEDGTEAIINVPVIPGGGAAGEGIITPSSFGGGAEQIIQAPGLKASILAGTAKVEICGRPCVMIEAQSDADQVVCETPAIQTTASVSQFTIEASAAITGELQESTEGIGALAFDGLNLPGARNSGSNCYIGTKFEGQNESRYFVGVLEEVRFFMGTYPDKTVFNGNLKFQGSNEDFSETTGIIDIFTVSSEIHEGWNYYKLNEHMEASAYPPKYRYYRLFNAENNGCDYIGEINFIGQKVINEDNETTQCDIVVSGDDIESVIIPDKVEYSVPATPFVESISPRWGSVDGGTEVIFTGQNFNPEAGLYTIMIDEAPCTVTAATTTSVTCITEPRTCTCANPETEMTIHMG